MFLHLHPVHASHHHLLLHLLLHLLHVGHRHLHHAGHLLPRHLHGDPHETRVWLRHSRHSLALTVARAAAGRSAAAAHDGAALVSIAAAVEAEVGAVQLPAHRGRLSEAGRHLLVVELLPVAAALPAPPLPTLPARRRRRGRHEAAALGRGHRHRGREALRVDLPLLLRLLPRRRPRLGHLLLLRRLVVLRLDRRDRDRGARGRRWRALERRGGGTLALLHLRLLLLRLLLRHRLLLLQRLGLRRRAEAD